MEYKLNDLNLIKGQLIKSLTKNFINIIMNADSINITKRMSGYSITCNYEGRPVRDRKIIELSDNMLDDIFI